MQPTHFKQVVLTISDMLDLVGVDDLFHSKRVVAISLETGRQ